MAQPQLWLTAPCLDGDQSWVGSVRGSVPGPCYWTSWLGTQTVGLSAPPANLQVTPGWVLCLILYRKGMPSSGTPTGFRDWDHMNLMKSNKKLRGPASKLGQSYTWIDWGNLGWRAALQRTQGIGGWKPELTVCPCSLEGQCILGCNKSSVGSR